MTDLSQLASNLVSDDVETIPPMELMVAERRIKIILEENEHIPPTGQFFGVQGKGYILRSGEVADVPLSIVGILNTAIQSVPVKDSGDRVVGYRDRLRFPYRIITADRPA
jgi:hypothetical protein